jgi:signal transduction histidine kinase
MAAAERAQDERAVGEWVARSSRRAELAIALCRIVFCSLVLLRFGTIEENQHGPGLARAWIEAPVLITTIGVSAVFVVLARGRRLSTRILVVSVLLDATACALALLPGVLHPWASYRGLLHSADIAFVLVLCVSAGLRFTRSAAIVGLGANLVFTAGLLALDSARNGDVVECSLSDLTLYGIYFCGASMLGLALVTCGRCFAGQAAALAVRADAARHGLLLSLQSSHEAASLLSAARFYADALHGEATRRRLGQEGERTVLRLHQSLCELAELVASGRECAASGISELDTSETMDVAQLVSPVLAMIRGRFPAVQLSANVAAEPVCLQLIGGADGLRGLLTTLLVNACEGDGVRAASCVTLDVKLSQRQFSLVVADDGPGFAADGAVARAAQLSTKRAGGGLGLLLAHRIVAASGGELSFDRSADGWTHVRLSLHARGPATYGRDQAARLAFG